jgi:hypothetical protein
MAALKVKELRTTLEAFAMLYENAQAHQDAAALRRLSTALAKADNIAVDEVIGALKKVGTAHHLTHTFSERH